MKIDHVAIWTQNIEAVVAFYEAHFGARPGEMHVDDAFKGCFLAFDGGAKLEIMQANDVEDRPYSRFDRKVGLTHFSFAVPTQSDVDEMAQKMQEAGYELEKPPQMTDDGFYEFAVFDPDNNIVEIVFQL